MFSLVSQQEVENFKKVHLISREEFDCLTPEPPVDPNQEVPPGPPKPHQSEYSTNTHTHTDHIFMIIMSWFLFISSMSFGLNSSCFFFIIIITAPLFDTSCCVLSSVPTDALANKLFGAPEPSSIARSLPTTVPDSPNYRTPRTPRTPHRKDQTMTPRFYPVVKESRPVDAKVRFSFPHGRALLLFFVFFKFVFHS